MKRTSVKINISETSVDLENRVNTDIATMEADGWVVIGYTQTPVAYAGVTLTCISVWFEKYE